MAFGLMMLLLACLGSYFYYTYMQNQAELAAGGTPAKLGRNKPAARVEAAEELPRTWEYLPPGALVQLKDVGLQMLTIDGMIKTRHLFKANGRRWFEVEVDQGGRIYAVKTVAHDDTFVWVRLKSARFSELGVGVGEFSDLNAPALPTLTWEGTSYSFDSSATAVYCRNANELEPEPCLLWNYSDASGEQALEMICWQDGNKSLRPWVRLAQSQVEM